MAGRNRLTQPTREQMLAVAENPDIAKGTIGTVVIDMIKRGEDVSCDAIVRELEAIKAGSRSDLRLTEILATGALKVIATLRP